MYYYVYSMAELYSGNVVNSIVKTVPRECGKQMDVYSIGKTVPRECSKQMDVYSIVKNRT